MKANWSNFDYCNHQSIIKELSEKCTCLQFAASALRQVLYRFGKLCLASVYLAYFRYMLYSEQKMSSCTIINRWKLYSNSTEHNYGNNLKYISYYVYARRILIYIHFLIIFIESCTKFESIMSSRFYLLVSLD